jgi:dihydropteroate synthase
MNRSPETRPRQPAFTRPIHPVQLPDQEILVGERTLVMGILNCTPDSFYDGDRHASPEAALRRFHEMIAEGADWIDVGGESTRPGAAPIDEAEEWRRIAPVLEAARRESHPVPISVDTTKSAVAERALDAGAALINDISALRFDPRLADLAARYRSGLVLMHMRGNPRTMQRDPTYADLFSEIRTEFAAARDLARDHGVRNEQMLFDPGIGFGKTVEHNLELIRRFGEFASLDRPLLIGCSRKSFIGAVTDKPPAERLAGTLAAHTAAVLAGAHVVRVHDVAAHVDAMRIVDAVLSRGAQA